MSVIANEPVLCVDLDGTLVATDTLHEGLLLAVKRKPSLLLRLIVWLFRGKAGFKRRLASEVIPDAALLPYRAEVVEMLRRERARGRRICLVTASDQRMADAVATHLSTLFDEAWGSDGTRNLSGKRKRDFLVERFGEKNFDYCGDAEIDLNVWAKARRAIVVSANARLVDAARQLGVEVTAVRVRGFRWHTLLRALRVHQWAKNVLVFTVLVTGHKLATVALWGRAAMAFAALCCCASAIYIVNDLLDLEADRRHLKKRHRPFASGALSARLGIMMVPLCLAVAAVLGTQLNIGGQLLLCLYPVISVTYSFYLKRVALVDVFTLSLLYVVRVLLGATVTAIACTQWLMAFCVFLFLSLAFSKRASELIALQQRHASAAAGRAYFVGDLSLVQTAGVASCFTAGMVMALYVQSDAVHRLYRQPQWLWVLIFGFVFWLLRVWLITMRGELDEDPVLFTLRDVPSMLLFAAMLVGMLLGWAGTPAFPGLR